MTIRKRITARTTLTAFAAVAAAVSLTSGATAGPDASTEAVLITSKGMLSPNAAGTFVLTPASNGPLGSDSGTQTSVWKSSSVVREQQYVAVEAGVTTYKGKRGTFVIRYRDELLEAGNGYGAIIGTWTFVRGTGAYAGATGGGVSGGVWIERSSATSTWNSRASGVLRIP